jgi:HPt (histidine-containing phosphotransfer) domain-containing protein
MTREANELEFLPTQLPGFDLPEALIRLNRNEAMLAKLLHRFASDYAAFPAEIDQLIHEGQVENAAGLLHRIRGVSATLGATELAKVAKDFEIEIRSGHTLDSRNQFSFSLAHCVKAILDNVPPPKKAISSTIPESDIDFINAQLPRLAFSLKNNEMPQAEQLAKLMTHIAGHVSANRLNELERNIQNFDFENAEITLTKIIEEWAKREPTIIC